MSVSLRGGCSGINTEAIPGCLGEEGAEHEGEGFQPVPMVMSAG